MIRPEGEHHHGLMLTSFTKRKENKWSYDRGETIYPIVERGEFTEIQAKRVNIKLKEPLKYTVYQHERNRYEDKDCYKSHIDEIDVDQNYNHHYRSLYSSTIAGALARLRNGFVTHRHNRAFEKLIKTVTYDKSLGRSEITKTLEMAAILHWQGMSKSCLITREVTMNMHRLDLVVLQWQCAIGLEIKSCRSDFTTDSKWEKYRKYVDRFGFVTLPGVIDPEEIPKGVGIYTLNLDYKSDNQSDYKPLKAVRHAKLQNSNFQTRASLYHRLLWNDLVKTPDEDYYLEQMLQLKQELKL